MMHRVKRHSAMRVPCPVQLEKQAALTGGRWLQEDGSSSDAPIARSIVQRLQRFGTYGRLKQVLLDSLDRAGTTTYGESWCCTHIKQRRYCCRWFVFTMPQPNGSC